MGRNLYGTTSGGVDPQCRCGTVYKLDAKGNFTVLQAFADAGAIPRINRWLN